MPDDDKTPGGTTGETKNPVTPNNGATQKGDKERSPRVSRRQFLYGVGAAGAVGATALLPGLLSDKHPAATADAATPVHEDHTYAPAQYGTINVTLAINGHDHKVSVEPRTTLLNTLRDHLDTPLTGTKLACDRGNCGACTVDMGGKTVYSCMILAVDAAGKKITTIEGVAPSSDKLHPIQEAFVEHDALQCGFCTPGFVMSVRDCINRNPHPTVDQVRHACSGNLCRCGTYPRVFDAALDAAGRMHGFKEGID